jgi:hypothetical protein
MMVGRKKKRSNWYQEIQEDLKNRRYGNGKGVLKES